MARPPLRSPAAHGGPRPSPRPAPRRCGPPHPDANKTAPPTPTPEPARPAEMDFTTAKEALFRQCALRRLPGVDMSAASSALGVEVFEDFLQLRRPVTLRIVRQQESEDVLTVASSSPIANHLAFIAQSAPVVYDASSSQVDHMVMERRIRDLVSLPEQIAAMVNTDNENVPSVPFNSTLYVHQLSVCILLFSMADKTAALEADIKDGVSNFSAGQRRTVSYALIRSYIKRGLFTSLLSALQTVDDDLWRTDSYPCNAQLLLIIDAVKVACLKPRLASGRHQSRSYTMGRGWHEFCSMLISIAQKLPSARSSILQTLCAILTSTSSDMQSTMIDPSLTECTKHEFFSYMPTAAATPRGVVRFILRDLVHAIKARSVSTSTSGEEPCLKYLFKEVFSKWGDKSFAEKGSLDVNTTVMSATMYCLDTLHQQSESLPPQYLGSLLNGVTARLDSARSDNLRQEGMTVAAAFTAYFVPDEETSNSLFSEERFVSVLKKWSDEEESDMTTSVPVKGTNGSATSVIGPGQIVRVVIDGQYFPLDPDEPYHYFGTRSSSSSKLLMRLDSSARGGSVDVAARPLLPAFGTQQVEKDELGERIQLLDTLRENYNFLLGIGRHPNAQMHEVQENLESGLRGFTKCLEQIKSAKSVSAHIQSEVDGMLATLLPTLLTMQIHAPDEKHKMLNQMRHQIVVDLISLSPKIALLMLSQVIYSANYSVFQRTSVVRAIGEAAKQMAHVRLDEKKQGDNCESATSQARKRLYPPIPHESSSPTAAQAIVVSEGTKTKRWGYVLPGRAVSRPRYENRLAEHATAFMAALLSKTELDHFKFFQDHDVYTPSEILKTMMIIVQASRTVRHVISSLCQQALTFLLTVITEHPHDTVRRLAWLVSNEAMRAWCGAAPLIDSESDEIGLSSYATAAHVHSSLVFSEEWMQSLEALQVVYARISKKDDPCTVTAALVVSGMRDLVCEKKDLDEMQAQYSEKVMVI